MGATPSKSLDSISSQPVTTSILNSTDTNPSNDAMKNGGDRAQDESLKRPSSSLNDASSSNEEEFNMDCVICWNKLYEPADGVNDDNQQAYVAAPVVKRRSKRLKRDTSDPEQQPEAKARSTEMCTTPCGHVFHKICLEKWILTCNPYMTKLTLTTTGSCPKCRKSIQPNKLYPLYFNLEKVAMVSKNAVGASNRAGPSKSVTGAIKKESNDDEANTVCLEALRKDYDVLKKKYDAIIKKHRTATQGDRSKKVKSASAATKMPTSRVEVITLTDSDSDSQNGNRS